ncbi:MAG: selenocysteine-specific translation elongation factor [Actinomycetota bacterium]|nr:selenocysteine-specific translation elongation factor [Actinomycetota bacterium]
MTIGTAGHIDHGKTWLVRALTGKDTDRLPEEQERGISIELGYAPLELPDGRQLSVVDVPGHERFVRTMVAGATGIDLFLLAIDAAEGARPQTHEHLQILRLLDVERGVVAVTKSDAVDDETLELALAEARELVPGAEAIAVSAKTGEGLDDLRAALSRAADAVERPPRLGATRLYVDRVFTLKGIGTVATGTLWSGAIAEGDELHAEPEGLAVRVRSVQVHDRPVDEAEAGQRVAVNLAGLERTALHRGTALVAPDSFPVTYRLDVRLDELEPLEDGARLTVHHGTSQHPARLVRAGGPYAQLRLATACVAARGDRLVLRRETTVGGARVLDPDAPRALDLERLQLLDHGDAVSIVRAIVRGPRTGRELQSRGLLEPHELAQGLGELAQAGEWFFAPEWLNELRERVRRRLAERAEAAPLDPGIPLAELLPAEPWASAVTALLHVERRGAKAYLPGATARLGKHAQAAAALEAELAAAGSDAIKIEDRALAAFLEEQGRLVRVGDGFAIGAEAYAAAWRALVDECESQGRITLARFRDVAGNSRRSAQLILERFDADGLTRRIGDERVLRRSAVHP